MTGMAGRSSWLGPIAIALSAWLGACSSSSPRKPDPSPANADLAGTSWRLVEFRGGDDSRIVADDPNRYTLDFREDGSLFARVDCNRGRTTWKASGPQLDLGPLALTRMACPPTALYDSFVRQWPYITSYVMKDDHLFLALMADGGIYEFEPVPTGGRQATLQNTYWKLTQVGGKPSRVAGSREAYLILHPDDAQVVGNGGCNGFGGSYELKGASLRFLELTSTLMACIDPEMNQQERAFLDALRATRSWRVTGDSLELSGEAGPLARFAAESRESRQ
jgi:heat shock protein HslJ